MPTMFLNKSIYIYMIVLEMERKRHNSPGPLPLIKWHSTILRLAWLVCTAAFLVQTMKVMWIYFMKFNRKKI